MTNPKNGTVEGVESEGPKAPRRRPATIDLEATEIVSNPAADATSQVAIDAACREPQGHAAAPPSEAQAAAPPPPRPAATATGSARRWFVAAFAGGVGTTALGVAALWFLGAVPPHRESDHEPVLAAQVAALDRRIQELAAPSPQPSHEADLEARLAALEAARSSPPPPPPDADATLARIGALEQRLNEVATRPPPPAPANPASDTSAATTQDIETLTARVAALEQRLRDTQSTTASDRAVRLALAAMALRIAVERGSPFASELAAVGRLVDDPAGLAPLKVMADTGLPAPAALAQALSKLTPAMLQAAGPPNREAGVLGRLQAGAERLVRIRRIDDASGDDPAAVIARADVKAARGDIAGALEEIDHLPDKVRAPASGWIGTARARLAALDAARQLLSHALQALGPLTP